MSQGYSNNIVTEQAKNVSTFIMPQYDKTAGFGGARPIELRVSARRPFPILEQGFREHMDEQRLCIRTDILLSMMDLRPTNLNAQILTNPSGYRSSMVSANRIAIDELLLSTSPTHGSSLLYQIAKGLRLVSHHAKSSTGEVNKIG
jgi:hypothetical protein